jgi:hypothetical protein
VGRGSHADWERGADSADYRLKCYVVIDLKVGKLDHGDLGQMQLYDHYYDREVTEEGDNPTVGQILCTDKNEAMVRYVLADESRQIFASRYQLQLPSEETLRSQVERELERLDASDMRSPSAD